MATDEIQFGDNDKLAALTGVLIGADLVIIAPASANTIAKLAHGQADNLLTTTVLASDKPLSLAPAMNSLM